MAPGGPKLNPTTHDVIVSHVENRLSLNHSTCVYVPGMQPRSGDISDTPIGKAVRDIAYQLYFDYKIYSLVKRLKNEITPSMPTSMGLVSQYWVELHDHIFMDKKISWNRLALVILICTELCNVAYKQHNLTRLKEIVEWTGEFFGYLMMDSWIKAKGGWGMISKQRTPLPQATPFPVSYASADAILDAELRMEKNSSGAQAGEPLPALFGRANAGAQAGEALPQICGNLTRPFYDNVLQSFFNGWKTNVVPVYGEPEYSAELQHGRKCPLPEAPCWNQKKQMKQMKPLKEKKRSKTVDAYRRAYSSCEQECVPSRSGCSRIYYTPDN